MFLLLQGLVIFGGLRLHRLPMQVPPPAVSGADQTFAFLSDPIAWVDFDNVDIHDALKALFDFEHQSYKIDADVSGTVPVHLKGERFETCLQKIVCCVDGTDRYCDSRFEVVRRDEDGEGADPDRPTAGSGAP